MKKQLIQLAKEKKYVSEFLCNTPYKYNPKENLRWYLWLCELQKWLREIHNKHLNITFLPVCKKYVVRTICEYYRFETDRDTYEEALEAGLQELLKHIKS